MLGAFASAPLDSEAARAFLQRRLYFFAKVFTILLCVFQALARAANFIRAGALASLVGPVLIWLQLGIICLLVAALFRLRTGTRSNFELRALDTLIALVPPVTVATAVYTLPAHLRPELLLVIVLAHVLLLRAVVVPSTPRRTLILALIVNVPVNFATYWFYSTRTEPGLPPVWLYVLMTFAWTLANTVITTLISYTIFGLRQKVALASQLGQYTLERKIGQGGMGVVYRARHALLRRPTAIKLLSAQRSGAHDLLRFEREVQLTSQLTHPNTIAIYDYGRTPQGVFYYAMEYLDGLDLQQLVECSGPQAPACVLRIMEQVGGALAEAHALGLIHRDIKPANVILCERGGASGVAKVVDFGLAKSLNTGNDNPQLSSTQSIMGTPLYLSPEAIAHPEQVDARSDLYALGAVAYFLLTGTPVFNAETIVEICAHHLHTQPEPPGARSGRALPADFEALVMRLLAKDREQRPDSAPALLRELSRVQVARWDEAEAKAWWASVKNQRAHAPQPRSTHSPGSSQTLAVDFRYRAQ